MNDREETKRIKYTKGYKYMLEEDAWVYTGIRYAMMTKRVTHFADGWMLIKDGFGSDGPSGPTWDDKTNIRAGFIHDALYYLHRRGLPMCYRIVDDNLLEKTMIEDGAPKWRAAYYKWAVQKFGQSSAEPKNKRKVLVAP